MYIFAGHTKGVWAQFQDVYIQSQDVCVQFKDV